MKDNHIDQSEHKLELHYQQLGEWFWRENYHKMMKKEIENLIKENFKDTALRIYELDDDDRKSLLAEYREWIMNDLDFEEVMMLPYEAYTDKLDSNFLEDSL